MPQRIHIGESVFQAICGGCRKKGDRGASLTDGSEGRSYGYQRYGILHGALSHTGRTACLHHYSKPEEVESLKKCIASIGQSSYRNYEVIVVENNSDADTFDYYRSVAPQENCVDGTTCFEGTLSGGQRLCVAVWKDGFNYSALNNFGTKWAKGSYYVLMNNDIEMISDTWLSEMLGTCQRDEVGIVGVKLYYPDDTVQHAGVVVGIGGAMPAGLPRICLWDCLERAAVICTRHP